MIYLNTKLEKDRSTYWAVVMTYQSINTGSDFHTANAFTNEQLSMRLNKYSPIVYIVYTSEPNVTKDNTYTTTCHNHFQRLGAYDGATNEELALPN